MKPKIYPTASLGLLAAASAQANIVHVTPPGTIELALGQGTEQLTPWDIDDNGTTDFFFRVSTGVIHSTVFMLWNVSYNGSLAPANNNFVATATGAIIIDNFPVNLNNSNYIGANLPGDLFFQNTIATAVGQLLRSGGVFDQTTTVYVYPFQTASAKGQSFDVTIGFRFEIDGALHYGWVDMELAGQDAFGPGTAAFVRIEDWAYNDVAGAPINAGQIPEPGTAAVGLSALALGAAGLRRLRKRSGK